jgi:hypothetical protein
MQPQRQETDYIVRLVNRFLSRPGTVVQNLRISHHSGDTQDLNGLGGAEIRCERHQREWRGPARIRGSLRPPPRGTP